MSSARRPLLTATAAGTLLGALWFVPNAQATQDEPTRTGVTTQVTTQARAASTDSVGAALTADTADTADTFDTSDGASGGTRLADTGSFDTTPYIVGGTGLLALGAGFVAYSVRRERLGF
ncbi:cell wall protein [Streptomyces phaeoluteigriseus]|uniref:Cell wall protein n=1 Tax=Streptomyces phaeoluteigriseus TaxID=114686 RepID=A0A1V6MMQ6_9ACTN|nr:LPXTG cell wall anchor domain-containing protein [Streptomyces phaeoluteigriseus]OQD53744.1 cell wall protein [Streptomyces phaeoluteigriseus]